MLHRLFCLFVLTVIAVPSLAGKLPFEEEPDLEGGNEILLTRIPWNIEDGEEETGDVNPESPFPDPDQDFGGGDETGDGQGPLDGDKSPERPIPELGDGDDKDGDGDDDGDDDDDDDGDDDGDDNGDDDGDDNGDDNGDDKGDGEGGSVDDKVVPDILGGISFFDIPLFNLEKVRQYFHDLERALGNVLRQTIDEALLLNGTYANTTQEEVDIGGKKYIVHKSIIKGGDNESSIYVETLSSKRKEGENGMEIRNETKIVTTSGDDKLNE